MGISGKIEPVEDLGTDFSLVYDANTAYDSTYLYYGAAEGAAISPQGQVQVSFVSGNINQYG